MDKKPDDTELWITNDTTTPVGIWSQIPESHHHHYPLTHKDITDLINDYCGYADPIKKEIVLKEKIELDFTKL